MLKIALQRKRLGLSQARLAQESGVSLPTVQNLEAGRGNPTLEVLERIGSVLGASMTWSITPPNWGAGSHLGLPLMNEGQRGYGAPSADALIGFLRGVFLADDTLGERETQATGALLLAVYTHFPKLFHDRLDSATSQRWLERARQDPKVLKLKRIALARIAEYL